MGAVTHTFGWRRLPLFPPYGRLCESFSKHTSRDVVGDKMATLAHPANESDNMSMLTDSSRESRNEANRRLDGARSIYADWIKWNNG